MNKESLLRNIALTGYKIGLGAKKHFLTYYVYRFLPKYSSFCILAIGIFQLTAFYKMNVLENGRDLISVVLIIGGLISLVTDVASKDIKRYNAIGQELLKSFDKLRSLYNTVRFINSADIDLTPYELKFEQIEEQAKQIAISDQAVGIQILSYIYFFSTMQIDWIDEQFNFKLKDKFPYYHFEAIGLYVIIIIIVAMFVRSVLM